jgi:hypothetical protein
VRRHRAVARARGRLDHLADVAVGVGKVDERPVVAGGYRPSRVLGCEQAANSSGALQAVDLSGLSGKIQPPTELPRRNVASQSIEFHDHPPAVVHVLGDLDRPGPRQGLAVPIVGAANHPAAPR